MLILASASPRRRELMEKLHIPFQVVVSDAEEERPEGIRPEEVPVYLASQKAEAVAARLAGTRSQSDVIIGSDTIVLLEGRILGKPHSREEAFDMLKSLSGRMHSVLTGVCLLSGDRRESFTSRTEVRFYPLSDEEIHAYIASGEPMDKAGAYGIQGDGALFVKEIRGDYYTVVGLPVAELARRLRNF